MRSRTVETDPLRKSEAAGKLPPPITDSQRLALQNRLAHLIGENRDDLDRLMQLAAVMTAEALGPTCVLVLLNEDNETIHVAGFHDTDAGRQARLADLLRAAEDLPAEAGPIGRVIQSGRPLRLEAADEAELRQAALPALSRFVEESGVSSNLIAPLRGPRTTIGAFSVYRRRGDRAFDEGDEAMLVEMGYQLALAVESQRLIASLHVERRQTERYFQGVVEATPDGLVMVDVQGQLLLVNRQTERMFGYGRHEILGQNVEILIPERLRGQHPFHRAEYMLDPHIRPMGAGLDLFAVRKDGSEFPVEISLSPLQVGETPVVVAAIRDISGRKQREAALLRSQHSLAEAQAVAHLGSLDYDMASEKLEASDEALRIFGLRREEFQGSDTLRARMHPDDEARVVEGTRAAVENRGVAELEFRVVRPDGSVRIVHDRVIGVYDESGKPVRMVGTVQDVTEQRQTEQEMAEMKSHLESSAELERLRLAQELHDGPMQDLYGATYRLNQLQEGLDSKLQADLQDVNEQLQHTIRELRGMAKELRPPSISNFGLEKAIRSYAEDFRQKYPNIELHLSLAQDRQLLPENMRLTLFRVFQQALTNVLRHSQASEVRVRFSLDAEEARLEVSDNGLGFPVPGNWMGFVRKGHYGLAGAAERVSALGGVLRVESEPHRATKITAIIPWRPEEESRSQ